MTPPRARAQNAAFEEELYAMHAEGSNRTVRPDASGFALVLAILSLMLLTFLGLTLATTSSTELQIATNYRWSQQALYNAEAGLEAAKLLLSAEASASSSWTNLVPAARGAVWPWGDLTGTSTPAGWPGVGRDFERSGTPQEASLGITSGCQGRVGRMGYGRVLTTAPPGGIPGPPGNRWENVTLFMGQALNGSFTLWVRRQVQANASGMYQDDLNVQPDTLVVTSEGVAPFTSTQAVGAVASFTRANQAVRVLEMTYTLVTGQNRCDTGGKQEGGSQFGEGFNPCARLTEGRGGSHEGWAGAGGGAGRVGGIGSLTRLP